MRITLSPPTLIPPMRLSVEPFGITVNVTVPLPVPEVALLKAIQALSLDADQAHVEVVVIAIDAPPPLAGIVIDDGLML